MWRNLIVVHISRLVRSRFFTYKSRLDDSDGGGYGGVYDKSRKETERDKKKTTIAHDSYIFASPIAYFDKHALAVCSSVCSRSNGMCNLPDVKRWPLLHMFVHNTLEPLCHGSSDKP